jgi:rhodanese-related sulfurtransferase
LLMKLIAGMCTTHSKQARWISFLLDVRSPESFRKGHLPGAVNLPHGRLVDRNLQQYAPDTLFVVYCAGPHCNGADKGARRLASLGRFVKKMIGGIEGWKDEGFPLTSE